MFVLTKIFGDYYQAKIIEIFLENYDKELTIPEIIEMAETSRGSSYKYFEHLVSEKIVKKTRKIGKTQLYQLNLEHPITKILVELEHYIFKSGIEKLIGEVPKLEKEYHIEPIITLKDKDGSIKKQYEDGFTEVIFEKKKSDEWNITEK
jgi:hypothetical protein